MHLYWQGERGQLGAGGRANMPIGRSPWLLGERHGPRNMGQILDDCLVGRIAYGAGSVEPHHADNLVAVVAGVKGRLT